MCVFGSVCRVSVYLKRFASSMNGRFWHSVNSFHSAPRRFDISELCIFGLSCAIFRRCPRDHTIKAFIGRFIWSDWDFNNIWDMSMSCLQSLGHRTHTLERALLSILYTFQYVRWLFSSHFSLFFIFLNYRLYGLSLVDFMIMYTVKYYTTFDSWRKAFLFVSFFAPKIILYYVSPNHTID